MCWKLVFCINLKKFLVEIYHTIQWEDILERWSQKPMYRENIRFSHNYSLWCLSLIFSYTVGEVDSKKHIWNSDECWAEKLSAWFEKNGVKQKQISWFLHGAQGNCLNDFLEMRNCIDIFANSIWICQNWVRIISVFLSGKVTCVCVS